MKSFKQFLRSHINEAANSPGSATVFEEYIVEAWNILLDNPRAEHTFTSAEFNTDAHQKYSGVAFKIAAYTMRKTGSKSRMVHSGADVVAITKEYMSYGGVDKTPKADIRTEDSTLRFSLKENVASQLLSGGKTDAIPVFKIAESRFAKTAGGIREIENIFEDILERIVPPKSAAQFIDIKHMSNKGKPGVLPGIMDAATDKKLRASLPADVIDFIDKVTFVDDKMKNGLTDSLNKLFNEDTEFKKHFTFEAASGAGKFADKAAAANSFLVFSSASGQADVELFDNHNSKSIVDLSKKLKFRLRWKHGSKVVLAGDIPKKKELYESYSDMVSAELRTLDESLNEGILDMFSAIKNWLKGFIKKVINQIKNLIRLGMDAVYKFFDIELTSVDASF